MLEKHKNLIESNPLSLATVMSDNLPNLIVVAKAKVVTNGEGRERILITDNYMGQTKRDIAHNSRVCLAVFNSDWEGVKIIGEAAYYDEGEWLEKVKSMPENEGLPAKGAILIDVEKVIELK